MKKSIFAVFICLCLISVQTEQCYASSGQLIIGGSSIAVGGLGASLAGLSGPVVVAVFVGLMAFGFNVELTRASEQAGMTKTQFVKAKIQQYCNEANITLGVFSDYILSEMTILNDGRIALGDQACKQIKQFGNWLVNNDMVQNPSSMSDVPYVYLNGVRCPVIQGSGSIRVGKYGDREVILNYTTSNNSPVALIGLGINGQLTYITDVSGVSVSYQYSIGGSGTYFLTNSSNGYYYRATSSYLTSFTEVNIIPLVNTGVDSFINSLSGDFDVTMPGISNDTFTGDTADWDAQKNIFNPADNKTTVINPNITNSITIPQDVSITWDWQKYLDAIQDIIDGAQDQDQTSEGVDEDTGIPIVITIPTITIIDPSIDKVDDTDLPPDTDQTPAIDKEDPPDIPELETEPLKFNLTNIFPFCIPFDIKDMLNKLNAEPVAPQYHVKWLVPIVNKYLEFDVDLSGFNSTAVILRRMELLAFVVGLAVATRQLFLRS